MEATRKKVIAILDGTLRPDRRRHAVLLGEAQTPRHGSAGPRRSVRPTLWASAALPSSTHDLTAARSNGIVDARAAEGLKCWADKAYQGAGRHIRVPFRGSRLKRRTGTQPSGTS